MSTMNSQDSEPDDMDVEDMRSIESMLGAVRQFALGNAPEVGRRAHASYFERALQINAGNNGLGEDENHDAQQVVQALLKVMNQKDRKLEKLKAEKKLLQQKVRRLNQQVETQQKANTNLRERLQSRADFDIQRVGDSKGLSDNGKWSWLSPTGCLNVAAP